MKYWILSATQKRGGRKLFSLPGQQPVVLVPLHQGPGWGEAVRSLEYTSQGHTFLNFALEVPHLLHPLCGPALSWGCPRLRTIAGTDGVSRCFPGCLQDPGSASLGIEPAVCSWRSPYTSFSSFPKAWHSRPCSPHHLKLIWALHVRTPSVHNTAHERGKLQCSEKIKVTEESFSGTRSENFHAVLSFMWVLAVLSS